MLNNKGYVFTPLILLFFILITITVFSFKQSLINSVNEASELQGIMDNYYYNYSKEVLTLINNFKERAYTNLSNSLQVPLFNSSVNGLIISDNSLVPLLVPLKEYKGKVNLTFKEQFVNVTINYPVASLLNAEAYFSTNSIQQCLTLKECMNNREVFDTILLECLYSYSPGGFNIRNLTVPELAGGVIYVNLSFYSNGMTLIHPFILKNNPFLFNC